MKRKLIAGLLAALSVTMVCPAYASTDHYTDSSVVGADSGWSDWDSNWENTATDFTKVSLTPGADDTQLNFAWYSEKVTVMPLQLYISEQIKIIWKLLRVHPVM